MNDYELQLLEALPDLSLLNADEWDRVVRQMRQDIEERQ